MTELSLFKRVVGAFVGLYALPFPMGLLLFVPIIVAPRWTLDKQVIES